MQNFRNYKDLILVLTAKEIKVRYKNNVLGYLWSIANPLAFALVFFVAFKIFLKWDIENYVLFLIAGLFPWQWFANSVSASCGVFIGNASIIKKVNFPRSILPLAIDIQDMVHFVLAIPVIVLFIFIYSKTPHLAWIYGLPVLLVIQLVMAYGVGLIVSSLNVFLRDIEKLTGIFLMLLFYLTPIIYPETNVPTIGKLLNPLAPLMISWRLLFLDGYLVPRYLLASSVSALFFLAVGYFFYKKLSPRFAEVL